MDNKPTYICDPEKNVNCPKSICQALGRGECIYTTDPEFAVNPDQPEFVIKESLEKYKDHNSVERRTNQDKLAEMVRTMDPERLAEYLSNDIFVCEQNCPIGYDRCPEGVTCEEAIIKWLKEDAE